jgi:uncharacterized protein YndB with AHSA1/START domain
MTPRLTTILLEQTVSAPLDEVYRAFTNASALREWFCDLATVFPKPGGRLYLGWHSGDYLCGEYLTVTPKRALSFTWRGRGDDRSTRVKVQLTDKSGSVLVRLAHVIPINRKWQGRAANFEKEWRSALDNLRSVLEEGIDLRLANRPMLGIYMSDFNAEIAARLGVPVERGLRLDGVVEGLGAHQAGLRKDDVIVSFGGKPMEGVYEGFQAVLQDKKAGDIVEVVYSRGPERCRTSMTLSGRPKPYIPATLAELVQTTRERVAPALERLEHCLRYIHDEEASRHPAPSEWSVMENLAHLIQNERSAQFEIVDTVSGFERWADDWGGNLNAQVAATVKAYPTLPLLLEELRRAMEETFALVESLPAEFMARKHAYRTLAVRMLESHVHINGHCEQIEQTITVIRGG